MAYMTQTKNLLDKHMRSSIHAFLNDTVMKEPDSVRIDELCFRVGAREGRCDIVVANSLLRCYEIKSDGDTNGLDRLSKIQVKLYGQLMDTLSVIVTPKHLPSVKRRVPSFWGVYSYEDHKVLEERRPTLNIGTSVRAVAGLLWKDSAVRLLEQHGVIGAGRKNKDYLHDLITKTIDYPKIHQAVLLQMAAHRRGM